MKQLVEDVIVEMILDDVLHGGHLFEANPNHDSKGRFTSKGATELYQAGALAFGRAKGMKAKVQGLGKDQIRAAIKGGIEQHLSKQGDREAGQARLALIRGKMEKGTIGTAPQVKEPKVRAPREAKPTTDPENMKMFLKIVQNRHGEALKRAEDAVRRIEKQEGDQIKARQDWQQAHDDMRSLRAKIEHVQGLLNKGHGKAPRGDKSPRIQQEPEPRNNVQHIVDYTQMRTPGLRRTLLDMEAEHQAHADAKEKARAGLRGQATHSAAGGHYTEMQAADKAMGELQKRMKIVRDELKKRGV